MVVHMSAAILLVAPLITGWILSSIIANPIFTAITSWNPHAFEISEKQKVEGAKEVHKAEMRMRMDAAIGRAPPLSYNELQAQLRHEAHELVEEFQEKNKHNVLNVISDGISATTGFIILVKDKEGRGILFRTFGRVFSGLSDTAKAFMIIASTDILLGYHSEEGWTAAIRLITAHYGSEVEVGILSTHATHLQGCRRMQQRLQSSPHETQLHCHKVVCTHTHRHKLQCLAVSKTSQASTHCCIVCNQGATTAPPAEC